MEFIHLGVDKIDVTMVECTCIPNKKMVSRPSHECQQYRFTIPLSLWYLKAMYIPMIPKPKASKCREKCTFFCSLCLQEGLCKQGLLFSKQSHISKPISCKS